MNYSLCTVEYHPSCCRRISIDIIDIVDSQFVPKEKAEAYHRMHAERLGRMGITGITATYRTLNHALSAITRGPIPG